MISKLWGWIVAAGMFLVATLLVVVNQRDAARQKANEAKRRAAGVTETRKVENAADQAQHEARQSANETRAEHEARDPSTRPGGSFRRR